MLTEPVGRSFTGFTVTCAMTPTVVDSAPRLSFATTSNAFSVPLAAGGGLQNALLNASIVSLVPGAKGVADPPLRPIRSVPVITALTTKASTVPSTSASSPWALRAPSVMVTSVSSSVVPTGAVKPVNVGASLTSVIPIVKAAVSSGVAPTEVSSTSTVTSRFGLVSKSKVTPAERNSSVPSISNIAASAPDSVRSLVPKASSVMTISAILIRELVSVSSANVAVVLFNNTVGGVFPPLPSCSIWTLSM